MYYNAWPNAEFEATLDELQNEYNARIACSAFGSRGQSSPLFRAELTVTRIQIGKEDSSYTIHLDSAQAFNMAWNDQYQQFMYRKRVYGYTFRFSATALDILLAQASIRNFAVFDDMNPMGDMLHVATIRVLHNNYKWE